MAENNKLTKEQLDNLKFTELIDNMRQFAKAMDDILPLMDLTSNSTKTWTVFNKETLRSYMQNPYAASSQTSLRNLSKFLYTLSFPLRRIVNYFASLPDFSAYKVNLDFSLIEDNDEESLLQDYENAEKLLLYLKNNSQSNKKAKIEEMLNAIKAQKEAAADEAEKQNDENDLTTDNITVTY
jgi:hypothetical protein